MFVVPAAIPASTPVVTSTVPAAGLLLVHVPPGVVVLSAVVPFSHTVVGDGLMADGNAYTVTTAVVRHPVGSV